MFTHTALRDRDGHLVIYTVEHTALVIALAGDLRRGVSSLATRKRLSRK